MIRLIIFIIAFFIIGPSVFAQNAKKMNKNLKVFVNENFDAKATITVAFNSNDRGNVLDAFKNALVSNGFKVISETSISRQTEVDENKVTQEDSTRKKTFISNANYVNAQYLITLTYNVEVTSDRGFIQGGVQCKDIRGQIVDLNNESQIVATFSYSGNFDADPVAEAVASKLKVGQ